MTKRSAAPLLVSALFLAAFSYLGAYAALVVPQGYEIVIPDRCGPIIEIERYRYRPRTAERVFWPLEQADRMLRPMAWERA